MTDTATPAARAWTPDPHRVAVAAIAVLDAGDALIGLLDRVEGLIGNTASLIQAADAWRTASRELLDTLNDDEDEVLL